MKATGIPRLLLLYPYANGDMEEKFELFQSVADEENEIFGIRVNPQIRKSSGPTVFADELAYYISSFMLPCDLR